MNEQMPTPTCLSCQRHSVAIALLQEQNDALTLQNELLEARIKALEAKLGTNSTNSHRPASTDPPSKPNKAQKKRAKRKSRKAKARKQGAQPGHKHHKRTLVPTADLTQCHVHRPHQCRACLAPLQGLDP